MTVFPAFCGATPDGQSVYVYFLPQMNTDGHRLKPFRIEQEETEETENCGGHCFINAPNSGKRSCSAGPPSSSELSVLSCWITGGIVGRSLFPATRPLCHRVVP